MSATNPFFASSTLPYQAPPFNEINDSHYRPAFDEGLSMTNRRGQRAALRQRIAQNLPRAAQPLCVAVQRRAIDFIDDMGADMIEKMPTDKLVDISPMALRMSSPFNSGYWLTAA